MAKRSKPEPMRRLGAESDDAHLLAAAARGDAAAFRSLLDRHLGAALATARRTLKDDTEAEDVVQEAMLRLWRSADRIDVAADGVRPWLRRVVVNLCIDRMRSGRRTVLTDEPPDRPLPAAQVRNVLERDLSTRVAAALQALPERQRMALTLFHYEGLSQAEVGEALEVSEEAVESLLARARRALKAALADEWQQLLPGDDT
ncbi:MAG: sigma-70 family RNA polymerase sigma factor [Hyphomicrobiaceae bacterium]